MNNLLGSLDSLVQPWAGKRIILFLDYDGTLTPIAASPAQAVLSRENKELLEYLAKNPLYQVVVISGRSLADVKQMVGVKGVVYIGNHGWEIESPSMHFESLIPIQVSSIMKKIKYELITQLSDIQGVFVEDKGVTLSVHYRLAARGKEFLVKRIFDYITMPYRRRNEIKAHAGKKVLELKPSVEWDKGKAALWLLRKQEILYGKGNILPVYIGDDNTDEDAFTALKSKGITVFVGTPKVFSGPVSFGRAAGGDGIPKTYDSYAIIGNCMTAALVSSDCSIEWLCLPFFDSPSLFGRILDEDKGGYFKISGVDTFKTHQSYIYHTTILKTVFETKHGVFEIRDYMPRFHTSWAQVYYPPEIHRNIRVIDGNPQIIVEFKPMPNYALGGPRFVCGQSCIEIISQKGDYDNFFLYTNLDTKKVISGEAIELKESSFFLLSYHEKLQDLSLHKIYVEYEKTKSYWLDWILRTELPEKYREMVIRSMLTLKLLTYEKTGAVIAAPTTSLPEIVGANRNWDYRFCWVRDASMIIDLYVRMGHLQLATRYIHFILNRMLLKHENIAVLYGINGEKELTEIELNHLSGYGSSRPVRIGNDAWRQKQNDVYGELMETIYAYFFINQRTQMSLEEELWTVVCSLVKYIEDAWKEPDCGIWERRGEPQHYVHSKMMSWVALDRAAKIAQFVKKKEYAQRCQKFAAQIKEDILSNGWSQEMQSFVMYYGAQELDASALLMLHYGFLDRKDPRMVSTVKQIYKHLVKNDFVFRYVQPDDFGVPENAFIVCTFWMVNALYLIGEEQKARQMFENMVTCANPSGLFSEHIEVATRRLTGNFPQGYSHLAFIQTVLFLETDYNWSDVSGVKNWLADHEHR